MQNWAIFCYFKHEIQLFKVHCTFELRSSQIWHRNVFNFFKFLGTNLGWGGGGNKPWSKNGDRCWMGGIDKIFAGWGTPSPPGKKTLWYVGIALFCPAKSVFYVDFPVFFLLFCDMFIGYKRTLYTKWQLYPHFVVVGHKYSHFLQSSSPW